MQLNSPNPFGRPFMMTMGILSNTRALANELQNFANWYSFDPKRELAAKAAVAEVIVNSTGVQAGFYSLHDHNSGASRQPVLPVRVPGQPDLTSTLIDQLVGSTDS